MTIPLSFVRMTWCIDSSTIRVILNHIINVFRLVLSGAIRVISIYIQVVLKLFFACYSSGALNFSNTSNFDLYSPNVFHLLFFFTILNSSQFNTLIHEILLCDIILTSYKRVNRRRNVKALFTIDKYLKK